MKNICFKTNKPYWKNKLFDEQGDLNFMFKVKKIFENKGFNVGTQDVISEEESDLTIYLDYRSDFKNSKSKKVLIAQESIAVIPETYEKNYLNKFDLVFTYYDKIVDGKNIIKMNYSYDFSNITDIKKFKKKKFLCNISANKLSNHKNELYSKRIEAIEFYENNYPQDFELFGYGWDKAYEFPKTYKFLSYYSNTLAIKILLFLFKRIPNYFNPFVKKYSTYRGIAKDKYETLRQHKFSICYENVSGVEGYVTEKIFDCFKCGTIPIYLGPNEISELIPKETFIDKRNFESEQDLRNYLNNFSLKKYQDYIENINDFLLSDKVKSYDSSITSNLFVEKILSIL